MLKYPKKLYIIMPIIEDYVHTFLNLFFFSCLNKTKKSKRKMIPSSYKNLQQQK